MHQLRRVGFGRVYLEHISPVNLLHGEEGRGHAAAGRHELPAAEAQLLAVLVSQFENPPLDTLLHLALRGRKILTIRNDLSRYRRCSRSRLGSCDKALFSFAKPTAHCDFLPIYSYWRAKLRPGGCDWQCGPARKKRRPITCGVRVAPQPATGRCCTVPSGSVARALTPENDASSVAPRSGGVTYSAVDSASAIIALAAKTDTAM